MAVEYKGILYIDRDYKKVKAEEAKKKIDKGGDLVYVSFVHNDLELYRGTLISEKDGVCLMKVQNIKTGQISEIESPRRFVTYLKELPY